VVLVTRKFLDRIQLKKSINYNRVDYLLYNLTGAREKCGVRREPGSFELIELGVFDPASDPFVKNR
jgi:hypothetical protein